MNHDEWLCANKSTGEVKYSRKENNPYIIAILNKANQPAGDTSMIALPFSRNVYNFLVILVPFQCIFKNESKEWHNMFTSFAFLADFCASTSCEHFCVNGEVGGICICKEGYTLNQDGKSCKGSHFMPSKFKNINKHLTDRLPNDINCISLLYIYIYM